jgi:CDP-diglyceride synthetase
MDSRLPRVVLGGILGGAVVGFLIGAYVVVLSEDHVIQRDDFAVALRYEQSQSRYVTTVLLAFVSAFAVIGPFVASASFGEWIRHAVYGLVSTMGAVVCVTLMAAAITNQQPINMLKGSPSTYIDIARTYAVPVAIFFGPVAGILIGRFIGRRNLISTPSEEAN